MSAEISASREQQPPQLFHPVGDYALLRSITLDDRTVSPPWVNLLNHHIAVGSQPIEYTTSLKEVQRIDIGRAAGVRMIGLHKAQHPLHDAFVRCCEGVQHLPLHLFDGLKALSEIGDPIQMVQRHKRILGVSGDAIRHRVRYLIRLANVLDWPTILPDSLSDEKQQRSELVRGMIVEYPKLLYFHRLKIGALARIAARFGDDSHKAWPTSAIRRMTEKPLEAHITSIARRNDYTLGKTEPGKQKPVEQLREDVYEILNSPIHANRVGKAVFRAYFRANPPTAEHKQRFQAIKPYLPKPKDSSRGNGTLEINLLHIPTFITGKEWWLREMRVLPLSTSNENHARRVQLLATLNWHIALGSRHLDKQPSKGNFTAAYEFTSAHRYAFFELLGWTNPNHVLNQALVEFQQKRRSLIPPRRVVDVLNALSGRGVRPITPILASYFAVLEHLPESLHDKLDAYENAGEDINERLQRGATPLRMNVNTLAARLALERERREARIAKGFAPKKARTKPEPGQRKQK